MKLDRNEQSIRKLARLSRCAREAAAPEGAVTIPMEDCTIHLPLSGVVDLRAETARLNKAVEKISSGIKKLEKKLGDKAFLAKAPEHVIDEQRERLTTDKAEAAKLTLALSRLAPAG